MVLAWLDAELPARTALSDQSFDIRPKMVEAWIEQLPQADVSECARSLFETLKEINRLDYHYGVRIKALELMREPTVEVIKELQHHYSRQTFPLSLMRRRISELGNALHDQLSMGYLIALQDLLHSKQFFREAKTQALVLQRAMYHFGGRAFVAYQTYSPVPKCIWTNLNQLYEYSESQNLGNVPIIDMTDPFESKTSVMKQYLRIALASLASPYRLQPGEIEQVDLHLARWVSYCQLQPVSHEEIVDRYFVVDLNGGQPPGYAALNQCGHACNCRMLNTELMLSRLLEELEQSRTEVEGDQSSQNGEMSTGLYRGLIQAWGIMPQRNTERVLCDQETHVAFGLNNLHHFLWAELNGADDDTEFADHSQGKQKGARKMDAKRVQKKAAPNYRIETWLKINESDTGCCLYNPSANESALRVGELAGVLNEDQGFNKWKLGVVRWIRSDGDGREGLRIGIELISDHAMAVAVTARYEQEQCQSLEEYDRGLMVPCFDSEPAMYSLILPNLMYQSEDKLRLAMRFTSRTCRLEEVLESTSAFTRFNYLVIDEMERSELMKEDKVGASSEEDFEDIWAVI